MKMSKHCIVPLLSAVLIAAATYGQAQSGDDSNSTGATGSDSASGLSSGTHPKRAPWQERLTLGPGDLLNFTLFGSEEPGRQSVPIGPDGRVSFLQARDIVATGLTIEELRAKFDEELSTFYRSPRTIITPAGFRSKKFYMLGAVGGAGVYILNRPTTVIEAIAQAGGLSTGMVNFNTVEMTDLSRSFIMRKGERVAVDFERLFQHGDLSHNILIEPEDYLYFASAAETEIYVLGAVAGPGVYGYSRASTMITAITLSGGFAPKAWQSRVLVVRGSLNNPETFVVDTKEILAAKAPDFKLQPRDIVYVHERPWARAEELLETATRTFIRSATITYIGLQMEPLITEPVLD